MSYTDNSIGSGGMDVERIRYKIHEASFMPIIVSLLLMLLLVKADLMMEDTSRLFRWCTKLLTLDELHGDFIQREHRVGV